MNFLTKIFSITSFKRTAAVVMTSAIIAASAFASEAAKKKSSSGRDRDEFIVVIDAGHGGHDHGAIDNGTREKDINLGVAQKFAANVKKRLKNVKVVMTRDDDTFISLQERANIANRNRGNLFVSIHTNSVDKKSANRKSVSGTSVYALGPQKDANNLKVAQRENSVIELEDNFHQKYSGFDPSKDESYIIFEMAQKKNLGQSLRFADNAQKELVSTAGRKDRGVKQAGFWVLWATSMPSVLVELDFICNPTEANFLSSEKGQQKLADALTNALEKYVVSYRNPATRAAAPAQNKSIAENQEVESKSSDTKQIAETATPDYSGVNTLVSTENTAKRTTTKAAKPATGNQSKSRKRRSEAAKVNSVQKSHETTSIKLKYEQELLARAEKVEAAKSETVADTPVANNDKKKSKKDKKKKDKKKSKKVSKKVGISSDTKDAAKTAKTATDKTAGKQQKSQNGRKTFVVKNSPADNRGTAQSQSGSGSNKMVYKIQILASDKKLDKNDSAFCGITPSDMFVENGFYKYTYGESTSRRQIEQELLKVKTHIPDAFIIVRIE